MYICRWYAYIIAMKCLRILAGALRYKRHPLERGGMPLHNAVGINYKKVKTTERHKCQVY